MPNDASRETGVLTIDIGSSSVRSMVFDWRARAIDDLSTQISYDLDTTPDGGVTVEPELLVDLVERCVDETLRQAGSTIQFCAVGMSSFWHSLLGLDRDGQPATPVLHLADSRSADVVDELRTTENEQESRRIAGTVFHSSYWPAKLLWLQQNDRQRFDSVSRWTSGADYALNRFTGATSSSVCMASGTGMLDISRCEWSPEIASIAQIDINLLPPLSDRQESAHLNQTYAERWAILQGVPWYPPLGDGACANVGSNATSPDRVALTLGTTGAVRVMVDSPAGQEVEPVEGLWTYRLDRRSIVRGAAITNGGIWVDFLRELLGSTNHDILDRAFELPAAEHGLTVLPFLAGERAPMWNDRARAVIAGFHPETSPVDMVRAGLESVAHRLRIIYDLVAPVATAAHLIVANGAALLKSDGWQQIVASSLNHEITTLPDDLEASARGAAMCALVSAGIIDSFDDVDDLTADAAIVEPDAEEARRYHAERERAMRLQDLLYPGTSSWDQML